LDITHTSRNVLTLSFNDVKAGWEKYFLLSSDRHWDSVNCDRKLMFEHLKLAKERDAHIIDSGDFFDMMQGKYDPRKSYSNMRPEYLDDNYLGEIVTDAYKQLKPYADRFVMLGRGNHDQAIRKHNSIDTMSLLTGKLNEVPGAKIQLGGYSGWIRFQFKRNNHRVLKQMYYFHGSGGGGEVTRGVIRTNRMSVYIEGADFVITGHTHDIWDVPITKIRLNRKGNIEKYNCRFINLGTYSDAYKDGHDGWWVESGKSPRPKGAAWLRFFWYNDQLRHEITLAID